MLNHLHYHAKYCEFDLYLKKKKKLARFEQKSDVSIYDFMEP